MERSQNDLTLKSGATCPPPFNSRHVFLGSGPSLLPMDRNSLHTIRLREPWRHERAAFGTDVFERRFHQPTGLDATSRVWLAVADLDSPARIELNGQLVAEIDSRSHSASRSDITSLLQPSNALTVTLAASGPEKRSGLPAQFSLEIE